MAELSDKNKIIEVNAEKENYTQARFASLDKNIIQPLRDQWKFIEEEKTAEKNPRSNYPAFLIELKETKNFETDTAKVEIERLGKMIEYYDSILGFILYVCLDMRGNRKVKHTDKIMEEMIPKRRKKYLNAKTINIKGEKTYPADIDGFDEKIEILRKYRAKKPE